MFAHPAFYILAHWKYFVLTHLYHKSRLVSTDIEMRLHVVLKVHSGGFVHVSDLASWTCNILVTLGKHP